MESYDSSSSSDYDKDYQRPLLQSCCSDPDKDYQPPLLRSGMIMKVRSGRIMKRHPRKMPPRARLSDRRSWNPNPLKKLGNGSPSPSPKLNDRRDELKFQLHKKRWPIDFGEPKETVAGCRDPTKIVCGNIVQSSVHNEFVKEAAAFAIEEHNKTGANLALKEIVKAYWQAQGSLVHYMTLETLDGDGDTDFYEAKVYQHQDRSYELTVFRKAFDFKVEDLESRIAGYADSCTKGSALRYQYRSENIPSPIRSFFDAYRDDEWFKNKYHPTNLLRVIERRNELAKKTAKDFCHHLSTGILDLSPSVTALSQSKSEQTSGKRRKIDKGQVEESEFSAALKAHSVSSEPRRIESDVRQALALVHKLDIEKGIVDNVLWNCRVRDSRVDPFPILFVLITSYKVLFGIELLDTLITYLWRIHGINYYGMIESAEPKGFRHVRPDGKNHGETNESGAEWEMKLDSFWQNRLRGQDPLEAMTGKEKIDAAVLQALDPYVSKLNYENNGWKYGCKANGCTELFHCAEFAHEHLKLKHPELVMELTSNVCEYLYFRNYMSDPRLMVEHLIWTLGKFHLPLPSAVNFQVEPFLVQEVL